MASPKTTHLQPASNPDEKPTGSFEPVFRSSAQLGKRRKKVKLLHRSFLFLGGGVKFADFQFIHQVHIYYTYAYYASSFLSCVFLSQFGRVRLWRNRAHGERTRTGNSKAIKSRTFVSFPSLHARAYFLPLTWGQNTRSRLNGFFFFFLFYPSKYYHPFCAQHLYSTFPK